MGMNEFGPWGRPWPRCGSANSRGLFWFCHCFQKAGKECRSTVRDEASVYFNVTAVHV